MAPSRHRSTRSETPHNRTVRCPNRHQVDYPAKKPLTYQSLTASIRVNGKDLPIYEEIEHVDRGMVECYIPSEEGESFQIYIGRSSKSPQNALQVEVFLDGAEEPIVVYVLEPNQKSCLIEHIQTSPNLRRDLCFQRLKTTDDDRFIDESGSPDLGSIHIRVFRRRIIDRRKMMYQDYFEPGELHIAEDITVHETSYKVGGLNTVLGPEKGARCKEYYYETVPHSATDKRPWAEFYFKYRSANFLKQHYIIPEAWRHFKVARCGKLNRLELQSLLESLEAQKAEVARSIEHQETLLEQADLELKQAEQMYSSNSRFQCPRLSSPEV